MSVTRTVLYLDHDRVWSYRPGYGVHRHSGPMNLPSLGELLERVAAVFPPEGGVLVLAGTAAAAYGLDETAAEGNREAPPVAGWKLHGQNGWWTYHRPRSEPPTPAVRVAVPAWMVRDQWPLGDAHSAVTARRLGNWHDMLGHPFYATPGAAAISALRWPFKGAYRPTWKTPEQLDIWRAVETPWRNWRAPALAPGTELVGFDRVRAGLATFSSLEVARHSLQHKMGRNALGHGLHFDPRMGGMWKIYAAPWDNPAMPNPAGPHTPPAGGLIIRATPTLTLLSQLTADGVYGGFDVVEAWISPAERLFQDWATDLRDGWNGTWLPQFPTGDAEPMRDTLKAAYRQACGLMGAAGGHVERYDWHNAHEALARATVWRAAWKAACQGVLPAMVDGDCVYYAADGPRPTVYRMPDNPADPSAYVLGQYRPVVRRVPADRKGGAQ